MIYPENLEQKIGFDKIRTLLKKHCGSTMGESEVDAVAFSLDLEEISVMLDETDEMSMLMQEDGFFSSISVNDLRPSLEKVKIEGLYLEVEEIAELRKALEIHESVVSFIMSKPEEVCRRLRERASESLTFPDIIRSINVILDKYGNLKDSASPRLMEIRREAVRVQSNIGRLVQSIMAQARDAGYVDKDVQPSVREGRLVVPVIPAYKRRFRGIVHDESATGKTIYIEPEAVVEGNNRLCELKSEERREIIAILTAFADTLRPRLSDIATCFEYLGFVDFVMAKAVFAKELDAIRPVVNDTRVISLISARHPILELSLRSHGKSMVPLDVRLPQGKRILLISGPNAGGKSVCLKTVGLLQYMMQCGMLVPVSRDSEMGVFSSMFIDIGDEQSIENDLSTYSSHLMNMKSIVKNGDSDSLILIDEFGSGTEPLIGGAIAEALLEEFDKKGIRGIITTHYTNLKHYADEAEAIVNGAMLYDRKGMCPLFQLQIGNPGSSFAIEIARKIGLPETVVQNAIDKVGEDVVNYDKHLQDIARDKKYWAQKRQQIRMRDKHIAEIEDKYGAYLENVNSERKDIIRKAKEEAKRILKEANANVENTIRQIKESQADKEQIKQARQKLSDANAMLADGGHDDFDRKVKNIEMRRSKRGQAEPKPENDAINVGDNVVIKGQSVVGQVEEINAKKAVVSFGQIRTTVELKRLEKVSRNAVKKMNRSVGYIGTSPVEKMREKRKNFMSEIDIRGMRADEAVKIVQGYIDDAIMIGIGSVRILHGTGTGALRLAVRQYLATVSEITTYHDEHVQLGGSGITVVEF
ncbi:MAG: Smr/MutS family protein [Paludibacteraceae bacterium]|nr:Smr/MutS family protein [Paludibacteraceae bacterium]